MRHFETLPPARYRGSANYGERLRACRNERFAVVILNQQQMDAQCLRGRFYRVHSAAPRFNRGEFALTHGIRLVGDGLKPFARPLFRRLKFALIVRLCFRLVFRLRYFSLFLTDLMNCRIAAASTGRGRTVPFGAKTPCVSKIESMEKI